MGITFTQVQFFMYYLSISISSYFIGQLHYISVSNCTY